MGTWGNAPFQSDDILDRLGGFREPSELYSVMDSELRYCDKIAKSKCEPGCDDGYDIVYSIIGVIVDSFGNARYACKEMPNVKCILNGSMSFVEIEKSFHETSELLLSTCALTIVQRELLLNQALCAVTKSKQSRDKGDKERTKTHKEVIESGIATLDGIRAGKIKPVLLSVETLSELKKVKTDVKDVRKTIAKCKNNKLVIAGQRMRDGSTKEFILVDAIKRRSISEVTEGAAKILANMGILVKDVDKADKVEVSKTENKPKTTGVEAEVISVGRLKGRIVSYTLVARDGSKAVVDAIKLKDAIRNNKISLVNYTLTSDNRLVESNR